MKNMFTAFILNLIFSIFEFIGGFVTGSAAIISDAVHDFGDCIGIGFSCFLEKKSEKQPDDIYTFGYRGYSVIAGLITSLTLLAGSFVAIFNALSRLVYPTKINYNGMLIFAIFGVIINSLATVITHSKTSINQKAINLHMLEDVLGWCVVLFGAIIMKFTDISVIDPIMSICVSGFMIFNAIKHLKNITDIMLNKTPSDIPVDKIKKEILDLNDVQEVHHIHMWSLDGEHHLATMHVVSNNPNIKLEIKKLLNNYNIVHSTIEIEALDDVCNDKTCSLNFLHKQTHHCSHRH